MAWNTGNSYVSGTAVTYTLMNGIGNDLRTWGGNVDAGGYSLNNCAGVTTNLLTILSGSLLTVLTSSHSAQLYLQAATRSTFRDSVSLNAYASTGVTSGDARIGALLWTRETDITSGKVTGSCGLLVANDGTLSPMLSINNAGYVTIAGGLTIPNLPSTNPGVGSKQVWYDPSDSNRVKYAP